MIEFWVAVLAISTLLYVLLDGLTLGIGILFGAKRDEAERDAMMNAVAPIWDGNQTWLVVTAVVLWGAFPASMRFCSPRSTCPFCSCSQG